MWYFIKSLLEICVYTSSICPPHCKYSVHLSSICSNCKMEDLHIIIDHWHTVHSRVTTKTAKQITSTADIQSEAKKFIHLHDDTKIVKYNDVITPYSKPYAGRSIIRISLCGILLVIVWLLHAVIHKVATVCQSLWAEYIIETLEVQLVQWKLVTHAQEWSVVL